MKIFFIYLSLFLFLPLLVQANIVINEFLIDPAPQKVEIINTGNESENISHWYIDDNGGTTFFTIPENTSIDSNTCLVFSGDFSLNKSSTDTIRLFDSSGPPTSSSAKLIDSFSYKASSGSGVAFFRFPDGSDIWATGSASFGSYNVSLENCLPSPTATPTPLPTSTPFPISPTISSSQNPQTYTILISEYMPAPSSESEWIELFNAGDQTANISNWYIDDASESGSAPYSFSLIIEPNTFQTVNLPHTMLNNSGDIVRLLNNNLEVIESTAYTFSQTDKSWGKPNMNDELFCLQSPTKNQTNSSCIEELVISTLSQTEKKKTAAQSIRLTSAEKPSQSPQMNINTGIAAIEIPSILEQTILSPLSSSRKKIQTLLWTLYGSLFSSFLSFVYICIHIKRRRSALAQ